MRESTVTPDYIYTPFKGPNSIRLLHILPPAADDESSPLRVSICEVSLDSDTKLGALSYTWATEGGDAALSQNIECDGATLKVTVNCYTALRKLQSFGETNLVWVDAICINQADDDEKGEQVRLMRQIYTKASWVILWLGEASEDDVDGESGCPCSDLGMKFIRDLAGEIQERKDAGQNTREGPFYQELLGQRKVYLSHGENAQAMSPRIRGFWNILRRPWWKRVWTLQELAFANLALVLCGNKMELFGRLAIVIEGLVLNLEGNGSVEEAEFQSRFLDSAFAHFQMRDLIQKEFRASVKDTPGKKALHVLNGSRHTRATDPRDKIYGILGFFGDPEEDEENIFPRPDYKKSAVTLYAEVARSIVLHTRNLDVMSSCYGFVQSIPNLPSWAPSWNNTPLEFFSDNLFNAAGGSPATVFKQEKEQIIKVSDDSEPLFLKIKGKRIDRVKYTSPIPETLEYSPLTCVRMWQQWSELALSIPSYPTGEDIETVLMYTLCWGQNEQYHRFEAEEYKEGFDMWLGQLKSNRPLETITENIWKDDGASRYARRATFLTYGMCMSTTIKSYLALVSVTATPGDLVVVLCGGRIPFVLRPDGDSFKVVGPCYVHGIMDGEAFGKMEEESDNLEWFTLC